LSRRQGHSHIPGVGHRWQIGDCRSLRDLSGDARTQGDSCGHGRRWSLPAGGAPGSRRVPWPETAAKW